jgi:hypothetical protein
VANAAGPGTELQAPARSAIRPDPRRMGVAKADSIRWSAQIAVFRLKFFLETLDSVTLLD